MSLMVKFGKTVIMQAKLCDEVKKEEWTDNKIYKNAGCIEIKPLFDIKKSKIDPEKDVQNVMIKSKNNREVLDKIGKMYLFPDDNIKNCGQFRDLYTEIRKEYLESRLQIKTENLNNFHNKISNHEETKNINLSDFGNFKNSKVLEIINKHRNSLLIGTDYKFITNTEKINLTNFLQNEELKRQSEYDINDVYYDLTYQNNKNVTSQNEYSLFSEKMNRPVKASIDYNRSSSENNLSVSKFVMFQDFRKYVNNLNLTENQIMVYFQQNEDFRKAAEIYFREVYSSDSLVITYLFPNNTQYKKDFPLTSSSEDLFMFIYTLYPDADDPKIFSGNNQIVINPTQHRFIGSLNIKQNSIINVKF